MGPREQPSHMDSLMAEMQDREAGRSKVDERHSQLFDLTMMANMTTGGRDRGSKVIYRKSNTAGIANLQGLRPLPRPSAAPQNP